MLPRRAAVAMLVACATIGSIVAPQATTAAVAATTAAVPAGDAIARVEKYLGALKTLGAEFVQVVRGKDGEVTERASGTLSISRPNRFRWDYREPYEQTIVADGTRLWLYDPDLDQVTVRSLAQGLGDTPAMLLSGAGKVGDAFATWAPNAAATGPGAGSRRRSTVRISSREPRVRCEGRTGGHGTASTSSARPRRSSSRTCTATTPSTTRRSASCRPRAPT